MQVIPESWQLIVVLTIPFVISWLSLRYLVFVPMMDYLAERREATEGARAVAAALNEKVEGQLADLQARLEVARAEVSVQRSEARARALAAEAAIVAEARGKADGQVQAAVARLQSESQIARQALRNSTQALAKDISQQVLGRAVEL